MNIVIFSYPNKSHYKVIQPLVLELATLENNVIYYIGDNYIIPDEIKKNKRITLIKYDDCIEQEVKKEKKKFDNVILNANIDFKTKEGIESYVMSQTEFFIKSFNVYKNNIINKVKEIGVDLIISDSCAYHGKLIAEELNIKSIGYITNMVCGTDYIRNNPVKVISNIFNLDMSFLSDKCAMEFYDQLQDKINNLSKKYKIGDFPIIYTLTPNHSLNIIFSSSILQPKLDKSREYCLAMPELFERRRGTIINSENKKKIYVSMGSQITASKSFYKEIIDWAKEIEYEVIISCKYDLEKMTGEKTPENVKVYEYANQEEILRESLLFITHGGYNSIYESIYYEVPMIVYPLINDQPLNAELVQDCKIGVNFKNYNFNKENLAKVSKYLIKNENVLMNLKIIKDDFYKSNNIEQLANKIILEGRKL